MIHKLIDWATGSRAVVILLVICLLAGGLYAFFHVNVEAYPDPAPAIIEVIAQYPGASAEEVERLVNIPLEDALAGMPGIAYTRSQALFQLGDIRCQFEYNVKFEEAKQEVLNRLRYAQMPAGVTPVISPETPTGEIYRYTLSSPKTASGQPIYNLNDLKALEDWTLEREFRRVPRIGDVTSFGGTVKRYEIQPDPDLMSRYGITVNQLQTALSGCNANVGGDYVRLGPAVQVVRSLGLIGGGEDPVQKVLGMKDPLQARNYLREEEDRRLREIRDIGITSTNNVSVRIGDVVDGGRVSLGYPLGDRGVIVGHQTRLGRITVDRPASDEQGKEKLADGKRKWTANDDAVEGIVLLRKDEHSLPALRDVEAKVDELNRPGAGRLPPGVKIEPYYDRTELTNVTRETVNENLLTGMILVSVILLMFLNNLRAALIVAINIPLALLFTFSVLHLRGKSANLLSIGAVDFGIIVDSSVIMVENIYRFLTSGEHAGLPLRQRIVRAAGEVERSLLFSTLILVCALLPLFTMQGPEGQLFGPMADTYAFALGGALLLAVTLSPVLCMVFFRDPKPARDNLLVRGLKRGAVALTELSLRYRTLFLAAVGGLVLLTILSLHFLGQEFMPELEEGNLWVRGDFPVTISLDEMNEKVAIARSIFRKYDEVEMVVGQIGRPDDGTDTTGFFNVEFFVPLKPFKDWPAAKSESGWRSWFHARRPRTKDELVQELNTELNNTLIGVDWNFSQNIRDNVMEALSGVKGENSVKIFGPDLVELDRLADETKKILDKISGMEDIGVFHIMGQTNLEFPIDRQKCGRWAVQVADVQNVLQSAVAGKPLTQMIEGEKSFDITMRWPERLRATQEEILNIPVEVTNNNVVGTSVAATNATALTGSATGLASIGTSSSMPTITGSQFNGTINNLSNTPRRRVKDLVTPTDAAGRPDASGTFVKSGATDIYREQGNRFIAVKFGVRGRDLGSTVREAQEKTASLFKAPYRTVWSGEFQEMNEALIRLIIAVSLSLALILTLLYIAFHSLLDTLVVLTSVVAASMGGIWALLITGNNFNISAGVGFISIVGVAVMNGLLLVSMFNHFRAEGLPLQESIIRGIERRARPLTMTALTAIFGLLPAALSTRIGSQTQRPLAIVVIGGMAVTLLLTSIIPVLYSFYGNREPPADAGNLGH
jgi:cobalt-zinc-cadmium resistance protein CzcA